MKLNLAPNFSPLALQLWFILIFSTILLLFQK